MDIGGTKTPGNHGLDYLNDEKSKTSSSHISTSTVNSQSQSNREIPQTSVHTKGGDSRGRMSTAQMQAQIYLDDKKIFELFNFLIGHLLVDEPNDPLEYLAELLDKCKNFRAGLCGPPLLFTPRHVESMFQSLDPGGLGIISIDQYKAGMTTLGIGCYDMNPKTCATGGVDKKTFEEEATKCLVSMLSEMINKKS